jgi:ubiquinone/menaquinone biosynthesis C-methylase UbiE
MNEYFFELFANLKRQGPGTKQSTHQAFNILNCNGSGKSLLDIGCGSGTQTFDLAEVFDGKITAIDYYDFIVPEFQKRLSDSKSANRITFKQSDMNDLTENEKYYDIIWSEGSIFVMGFENGLKEWKKFLKNDGYMVISEAAWFQDDIPSELSDFWQEVYPDITSINNNIEICKKCGYEVIDTFNLPSSGWTKEYYYKAVAWHLLQ